MLRTSIAHSGLASRFAAPHLAQASTFACRRAFSTTQLRQKPEISKFVTKEDTGKKGIPTEGMHYNGTKVFFLFRYIRSYLFVLVMHVDDLGATAARTDFHSSNQISKTPTGDWVLFHPVYVCQIISLGAVLTRILQIH